MNIDKTSNERSESPQRAVENLHEVIASYSDESDDMRAVRAYEHISAEGPNKWTGLTLGDLRRLAEELSVAKGQGDDNG